VSNLWLAFSFAVGILGALLGGWLCAVIARTATPPKVLAGFVLVLGILVAVPGLLPLERPEPPPRTADVTVLEAMQHSKTPPIALLVNPVIGAVGVLLGARLVRRGVPRP
jgi:uncharacterized membrane protein YeaQ/YmgE (transglycosylase-associated protein family)